MPKKKFKTLRVPVSVAKRMGDGPMGEQRWQIEVPPQFERLGVELEFHKGKYFVLIGPYDTEQDIEEAIK